MGGGKRGGGGLEGKQAGGVPGGKWVGRKGRARPALVSSGSGRRLVSDGRHTMLGDFRWPPG